jgi:FkbM family methyltransferase
MIEQYEGLYIRKGTQDRSMVRDALYEDYPFANTKDKVILDLGAHVGAFTKRALEGGAIKVNCVEPWAPNRELLEMNFGNHPQVEILPIAVASTPTITLSIPKDISTGAVSGFVKHQNPSNSETVKARTLDSLIQEYSPSFIKMDIEGAEWDIFPCDLSGVEDICGELHTMSNGNRQSAFKFLAWLENNGFYITYLEGGPKREKMFMRLMFMYFHAHKK